MTAPDREEQPWPILDQQAWLESQNAEPVAGGWFADLPTAADAGQTAPGRAAVEADIAAVRRFAGTWRKQLADSIAGHAFVAVHADGTTVRLTEPQLAAVLAELERLQRERGSLADEIEARYILDPADDAGALAAAYRLLTIAEQDAHSAKHAAFEQHLRAALHAAAQHAYPSPGDPS